ncbi:MAG: lipopolysaccharide assembly protein LapB, partial [Proteobacteria bacterium]|nr:lipopolysaccharide assembly protein LapB [Pseudomonadota bacterium]
MTFELWWLLGLPLFFVLGWMAARIDIKDLMSESRGLPLSYFKGLNFLLNEQPDKAIETLLEVARNDPQTVELHFSLGNLFRRRGEVERAIKMHQNLLDRPDLDRKQRLEAVFELGQDFLKAGFLDRAENLFVKLKGTDLERQGLSFLVDIYEQEKDWEKAIEASRNIHKFHKVSKAKEIANYYCELALISLEKFDYSKAEGDLSQAMRENRKCVRSQIILGDISLRNNDFDRAIECWKKIEKQDPKYLSLVAQRLIDAYEAKGKAKQGLGLLAEYLSRYPSYDLLNIFGDGVCKFESTAQSYKLVRKEVVKNPTLLGLNKLLELQILDTKNN